MAALIQSSGAVGNASGKPGTCASNVQPVGIRLSLHRRECLNCEEIFCSDHEGIVDNKNLTQTLYDHILEKSLWVAHDIFRA